jgi:hypothetical protein
MPSQYNALPLFTSGPHRFAERRHGQVALSELDQSAPGPGSTPLGLGELDVVIMGRLVAPDDAALWTLRDAIIAELVDPPIAAALEDHHGHQWEDMSFLEFKPADRTDRSSAGVSLAYTATFRRFNGLAGP